MERSRRKKLKTGQQPGDLPRSVKARMLSRPGDPGLFPAGQVITQGQAKPLKRAVKAHARAKLRERDRDEVLRETAAWAKDQENNVFEL